MTCALYKCFDDKLANKNTNHLLFLVISEDATGTTNHLTLAICNKKALLIT